jgi:hypothetical protein
MVCAKSQISLYCTGNINTQSDYGIRAPRSLAMGICSRGFLWTSQVLVAWYAWYAFLKWDTSKESSKYTTTSSNNNTASFHGLPSRIMLTVETCAELQSASVRITCSLFPSSMDPRYRIPGTCAMQWFNLIRWKTLYFEESNLGVQIDYDVVHLWTSLVQLFVLLQLNFEVVQIIELRRFGGAPNSYPFAALVELYLI